MLQQHGYIRKALFFLIVTSSLIAVTSKFSRKVPVPRVHPGFMLQGTRKSEIVVEVFLELNCKDSLDTWVILKEMVAKYHKYEDRISVVVHMFPLPYHRCGFLTSQFWNLVLEVNHDKVISYMDAAFNNLKEFSNTATANLTNKEITINLANLVESSTGLPAEGLLEDFDLYRKMTIINWKHAAKRGVAGTPWYFVNGVALTYPAEAISMEAWDAIFEPLLQYTGSPLKKANSSHFGSASSGSDCHIATFVLMTFLLLFLQISLE